MKNNKGFSLVELIIVIAIMAVLVGVLAPTYLQYVEKTKKSNDVSTVDSIVNAIEIAAIDPEVHATNWTSLKVEITNNQVTYTVGTGDGDAMLKAVKEIAAIDPETISDTTTAIRLTFSDSAVLSITDQSDAAIASSKWVDAITAAVGSNVQLKSKAWTDGVIIDATRNADTGAVTFKYKTSTSAKFKEYATSLKKVQ